MKRFDEKPLSWSAISSFLYDPEQWYAKYVLCIEQASNASMDLGKEIGALLASDPTFLPSVPRHSYFEYELSAKLGERDLIGYIDSYEPHTDLLEYKTGKKAWNQKRVDEHGQLTLYALLLNLMHKVKPEDIRFRLVWLPTQENGDFSISLKNTDPVIFETTRTMRDILLFGAYVHNVYGQMEECAKQHTGTVG